MKKTIQLLVSVALALPLAVAPVITSGVSAHAVTTRDYALASAKFYKHTKNYHFRGKKTVVYKMAFGADQSTATISGGKTVKTTSKVAKVDQSVVVESSDHKKSTKKNVSSSWRLFHVKKLGWVYSTDLKK